MTRLSALRRACVILALGAAATPLYAQEPVTLVVANSQWLDALRGEALWNAIKAHEKTAPHVTLEALGVPHEVRIVSAHRTPDRMFAYAEAAAGRGLRVVIAGAGGAAHLPGMLAAKTRLPVLGVPVQSKALNGLDSLLSIVQMPKGVPVGTLAIGEAGATNAGLLAAAIVATTDCPLVMPPRMPPA